jgi:hypothetical protein
MLCSGVLVFVIFLSFIRNGEGVGIDVKTEDLRNFIITGAGGLGARVVSYPLDFRSDYFPPVASIGRLSGMHHIAGFGAGVFAAAAYGILERQAHVWVKRFLAFSASMMVAGLVGFGFHVQASEYASHWSQQRDFWLRLVDEIRDIRAKDVVLFEIGDLAHGITPKTQGFTQHDLIYANFAFARFIRLPATAESKPSLHAFSGYVPVIRERDVTIVKSPIWAPDRWGKIQNENLIFLKPDEAKIVRLSGAIELNGVKLNARAKESTSDSGVAFSKLFWRLFGNESSAKWFTLNRAKSYP